MNFDIADSRTEASARRSGSLAGLAIALLLVVIGLYLVNTMRAQGEIQDCVISGHADCLDDTQL